MNLCDYEICWEILFQTNNLMNKDIGQGKPYPYGNYFFKISCLQGLLGLKEKEKHLVHFLNKIRY